jgi:tellurite resistance protein TerC
MLATIEITPWHWLSFILAILLFLAIDLGVLNRHAKEVKFKEALMWTCIWFTISMCFAFVLLKYRGQEQATLFVLGYFVELSLSIDNVFVIALIFSFFRVPTQYQRRVLFWGIMGALIMRGVMIAIGAALIARFHWMLNVFGAFLIVTGVKMLLSNEDEARPEENIVVRLTRRMFPVTPHFEKTKFVTRWNGKMALTPLAVVLVMVETTDLIFAVDSIPAIFGITQDTFIIFTSNVFAILGLRSLYFVLATALAYFRFLKVGLSIILVFIGVKMLFHLDFSIMFSFGFVIGTLVVSMLFSIMIARREQSVSKAGTKLL